MVLPGVRFQPSEFWDHITFRSPDSFHHQIRSLDFKKVVLIKAPDFSPTCTFGPFIRFRISARRVLCPFFGCITISSGMFVCSSAELSWTSYEGV